MLTAFILACINWQAVEAVATCVIAATAIATVLYAADQLGSFKKESRITHLIELVHEFENAPLADARRRLARERLHDGALQRLDVANPPHSLHTILNFFEHMGFLLRDGYVELEAVSVEFHYWIFRIWTDARAVIRYEQDEAAIYYSCFEAMVKRLEEHERKQGRVLDRIDEGELEYFYSEEADLPDNSPIPKGTVGKKKSRSR
jgi:hypothetical protein